MDRYLKPVRFDCDPNAAGADKEFKHWLTTFKNFAKSVKIPLTTQSSAPDASSGTTTMTTTTSGTPEAAEGETDGETDHKLTMLINYLAANVYEYIADCTTFDNAIATLTGIYIKI